MLGVSPNWQWDDGHRSVTKGCRCATDTAHYLWVCFRALPSPVHRYPGTCFLFPAFSPEKPPCPPTADPEWSSVLSRPLLCSLGLRFLLQGSAVAWARSHPVWAEPGSLPALRGPSPEHASRHSHEALQASQQACTNIKGSEGTCRSGWAEIEVKSNCACSAVVTWD